MITLRPDTTFVHNKKEDTFSSNGKQQTHIIRNQTFPDNKMFLEFKSIRKNLPFVQVSDNIKILLSNFKFVRMKPYPSP